MKNEILLNIGCGIHLLSGFINIDKYHTLEDIRSQKGIYKNGVVEKGAKFIQADVLALPFPDNHADYIECLDVIEHLPFLDIKRALVEMRRVLKPNCSLVLFTNNFDDVAKMWMDTIAGRDLDAEQYRNVQEIIYGNQAGDGEFHKTAFNPAFINYMMQLAGFTNFKMVLYPQYCKDRPPFRGAVPPADATARNGMIFVEAVK